MAFHQPYEIVGFHSCDRSVGLKILSGEDELRPSSNNWDWLGPGIYFWEQNPDRALEYAKECAKGTQKFSGRITTPFVIGAIIELGNCLNLVEPNSISIVKEAYIGLSVANAQIRENLVVNKGPNRHLDCTVIRYVHDLNKILKELPYDTVRCPFTEGGPIYAGANFTDRLHMEVCVCNPKMIKAYFLPRPIGRFNPYLN